jgi:hypothetical protein
MEEDPRRQKRLYDPYAHVACIIRAVTVYARSIEGTLEQIHLVCRFLKEVEKANRKEPLRTDMHKALLSCSSRTL